MRAREFIVKENKKSPVQEEQLDEVLPVLAAAGAGLARGAAAVGQGLRAGAGAVGQGVKAVGQAVGNVASKVGNVAQQAGAAVANSGPGKAVRSVGQALGGNVSSAQPPDIKAPNASGGAVGSSAAPAGPTTGGAQAQPDQKAQAQQQQQVQQQQQAGQETMTNLDKIAAQIVALKQDLAKQQQAMK
jgi:hypothetical protein